MQYFDPAYLKFFRDLSKNNHKEWFHANKKTYESAVKEPFKLFITDLLAELEKDWGPTEYQAKDYIMRINRDIRFSKDKSPYKTYMGAMMSKHGRKEMSKPGLFLQVNHLGVELYGGCYQLAKENLYNVRKAICDDLAGFDKLINAKAFKSTYGEIRGEKHKRLPKEFQEAAEKQPLIFNKGFYFGSQLPAADLTKDDLLMKVMKNYRAGGKVSGFLEEALGA